MPDSKHLKKTVRNNADWCGLVCCSQMLQSRQADDFWVCTDGSLPFYPNVISLSPEAELEKFLSLKKKLDRTLRTAWGVKDSFACLDLGQEGFRLLFEAEWIWLPFEKELSLKPDGNLRVEVVRDEAGLLAWERAWAGLAKETDLPEALRLFRPSLLEAQSLTFLAGFEDLKIVCGAAGLLNGEVLGLSNIFALEQNSLSRRAALIKRMREIAPGIPLVDYENNRDLVEMCKLGFEKLGPLRVWEREGLD